MKTQILKNYKDNIIQGNNIIDDPPVKLGICPSLDVCLDGGLQAGQLIEIAGPPKIGKTTLSLTWAKHALKYGYKVVYLDVEHRIQPTLLNIIGIPPEQVTIIRSSQNKVLNAVDYLTILYHMILDEEKLFIILDSVASLRLSTDDPTKATVGGVAKLLTQSIREANPFIAVKKHFVILLNHEKEYIDTYSRAKKTYTTGGMYIQFQCSTLVRLSFKQKIADKNTGKQIGHDMYVKILSAPTSSPTQSYLRLIYNKGIDIDNDIFMFAETIGLIKVSGSWFTWGKYKVQGKENFIQQMKECGEWDKITQLCYEEIK